LANRKLASEEVAEIAEARVDKGIKVEDVWNELKFYIVFSPKAVKNLKSLKKKSARYRNQFYWVYTDRADFLLFRFLIGSLRC
jgi:hypothetical protein